MRIKQKEIRRYLFKPLRYVFFAFAAFCLFLFIFSFTTGPFWIYYWLGTGNSEYEFKPDYIIVLGGSGMPSGPGFMRTYYAAGTAAQYPLSDIIICLPGDTTVNSSSLELMRKEIVRQGTDSIRVNLFPLGTNTRSQAIELISQYPFLADRNVLIITSPEHMYRSIMTFRKAGFRNIGGRAAFARAIETDIHFEDDDLGGNQLVPDVGKSIQLRYQFWNHLKYEIMIVREFVAIAYYKLKGWI